MDIGCYDEYMRICKRNACTVSFSTNTTRFPPTVHTMHPIAGGTIVLILKRVYTLDGGEVQGNNYNTKFKQQLSWLMTKWV